MTLLVSVLVVVSQFCLICLLISECFTTELWFLLLVINPGYLIANTTNYCDYFIHEIPCHSPTWMIQARILYHTYSNSHPRRETILLGMLHSLPVNYHQMKTWTDRDPAMSRVCTIILKDTSDVEWAQCPWWMPSQGTLSNRTTCWMWQDQRTTCRTSRCIKNDEKLCLVAWNGQRNRRHGEEVWSMPTHQW